MRRFPHIAYYLLIIGVLCFGVITVVNGPTEKLSLVSTLSLPFGIFSIFIGTTSAILFTIKTVKRIDHSILNKSIKWLKIIMLVIILISLVEYILFPVIRAFIYANTLKAIPPKSEFLASIAYIIIDYGDDFLKGVLITLELSLIGTVVGLILALLLVTFRTLTDNPRDSEIIAFLKKIGREFSSIYVNVFRGTPMMVQAVIIYYLLPVLVSSYTGIPQNQIDRLFTNMVAGLLVVSLNTAAYLTEVLRGAIEAIDKGQMEAARSLGLSYSQAMKKIIFPQAIKNALPSIGNEFIINIKDTSVLNIIGVAELFFAAQDAKMQYFRSYESFIIVALIYLTLTLTCSKVLAFIEKKMNLEARVLPSSN